MIHSFKPIKGNIAWRSPSNIAIVKYWGKYGNQLPQNPNISFTLSKAYSETSVAFQPKAIENAEPNIDFLFEGEENPKFRDKIVKFIDSIKSILPFLNEFDLSIQSSNSFPHSAGIASSASSMSALALCLIDIERQVSENFTDEEFYRKASIIARLGSGSACRSVYPYMATWGYSTSIPSSSNEYAIDFSAQIHPIFKTYKDAILIVSSDEKSVSSRAGHALMNNNLFAEARYQQAKQNMEALLPILKNGDINKFGAIAEQEALSLHALMMCSNPSFILMHANSLKIIDLIKQFRQEKDIPLYFTLDAGPNVHLLYPKSEEEKVEFFIKETLSTFCENGKVIYDEVGTGPVKLK